MEPSLEEFIQKCLVVDPFIPDGHIYATQFQRWYEAYPGWQLQLSFTRTAYGQPNLVRCLKCGWQTKRPTRHKGKCKKRQREQAKKWIDEGHKRLVEDFHKGTKFWDGLTAKKEGD